MKLYELSLIFDKNTRMLEILTVIIKSHGQNARCMWGYGKVSSQKNGIPAKIAQLLGFKSFKLYTDDYTDELFYIIVDNDYKKPIYKDGWAI